MRTRSLFEALAASTALVLGTIGLSGAATDPAVAARRGAVVAHVGATEVTVGELEDRIAKIPRFQLSAIGATPDAIRKKVLLDIVVPEILVANAATKEHLEREPDVALKIERALANATMRALRARIGTADAITMDEVRKYHAENKSKFDSPVRYNLWRILCAKREEAQSVLDAAKGNLTIDNFTKLAREHSIDKATNLRAGNLGFVDPDGNSNEAGVKVDPVLPRTASSVKDGQLVPEPVAEGTGFAVIWRRGTVAATHRTPDDAAPQIRDAIWRRRAEDASNGLIDELREAHLTDLNEGALNGIEVSAHDGNVVPRRRPGQVPPLRQAGPSAQRP